MDAIVTEQLKLREKAYESFTQKLLARDLKPLAARFVGSRNGLRHAFGKLFLPGAQEFHVAFDFKSCVFHVLLSAGAPVSRGGQGKTQQRDYEGKGVHSVRFVHVHIGFYEMLCVFLSRGEASWGSLTPFDNEVALRQL